MYELVVRAHQFAAEMRAAADRATDVAMRKIDLGLPNAWSALESADVAGELAAAIEQAVAPFVAEEKVPAGRRNGVGT